VFEIGSSLRAAREQRQLQLPEIERATRIRAKYLIALEEERFDVLPATAYAKGFLRTYADFLGLDGARFVDEFNERFAPAELPEAAPPVRIQRPRRLLGSWLVVIPLAVGVGLFVWRTTGGGPHLHTHRHAAVIPSVPHVRLRASVAPPRPGQQPPARAEIVLAAARGPCWLSVRLGSASGRVLYERTLEPGRRRQFAGARLWIRLGAPWNVDATVNGKRVPLPASVGDVMVTPGSVRSL
jgi:cytoskeleton protein RodZ